MAPKWLSLSLTAAGIYNLIWGAWVVLFPFASFDWLGMPRPNYPQFWQCIGMIVGVYGVGYLIAAKDIARHWPVILVGALGKIFGPIGFAQNIWLGTLPLQFGWHLVFNDFIWWIPFFCALRFAYRMGSKNVLTNLN